MTETDPPLARRPRDDEVDVHGLSHPGRVREENQDRFLIASIHKRLHVRATNLDDAPHRFPTEEQRLAYVAMVADGVGGGTGGAEASEVALEAATAYLNSSMAVYYGAQADEAEFRELLQAAAMRAHEAVRARRAGHGIRGTMATTLTLFIGVWPAYYLLQVGDSRYYVYRDGVLRQVTRDQTMAQELIDSGALSADRAQRTPLAHVLSSAIGADQTMPVVTRLEAHWGNVHLLCTDGLTKHVSDARIAQVLGAMPDARWACETLLEEALANGGTDNVTIIVSRTVPKAAP